jgi:hypothetical protein
MSSGSAKVPGDTPFLDWVPAQLVKIDCHHCGHQVTEAGSGVYVPRGFVEGSLLPCSCGKKATITKLVS